MQRIIVLAVFLALAFAQSPQNGVLTPSTIVSGQVINGVLPITTEDANYHVDLYQLWVPENTSAINITVTNTNPTDCDYLSFFIRGANSGGLPCSQDDYDSDQFPCAMDWDIGDIDDTQVQFLDASTSENIYEWEVNSWVYVAVGRYEYNYEYACTYTFTATINGSCPTGSIGYGDDYSTSCAAYTTVSQGSKMNISYYGADTYQAVYKLDIPLDTGHIFVQINSTDGDFELVGKNYGAPYSDDYNCDDSGYSYYDYNTSIYYMDYYCYTPRVGSFYMFLTNENMFNGSIQFSYLVCPAGMGGYNCTYSSVALNETNAQTFFVPTNADTDNSFAYVYVDIPANYTGGDYQVYASSNYDGYLYVRYGGYPADDYYSGYTTDQQYSGLPASFTLNNFDFYMSGRWYFGLECTDGTYGCNITVQKNNSNVVVSTTAMAQTSTYSVTSGTTTNAITSGTTTRSITSGTTTAQQTTTGSTSKAITSGRATTAAGTTAGATTSQKTSSAVAIIPSFVAAIFAILALF
jgi:hypothetical protein